MRGRRLIDTRGFFDPKQWQSSGFECYVLGRGAAKRAARVVA